MATSNGGGRDEVLVVERRLRTPTAAGVAGLVFAALFIVSILLSDKHPAAGSSAAEIAAWYLRNHARTLAVVGLYLVPFAGIAFLWFIAVIRSHIGEREDRFFATVFLGSGLLFVAMLWAAAASVGASIAAVKFQGAPPPGADAFVFARGLGYTFLYVYAVRAAAVFVISVSTLALRTGSLPRWLVFLGYAVAVVQLVSVSYYKGIVLIFPAWVVVVSIELLRFARAENRPAARA